LIGASKPSQIIELAETVKRLDFTPQELATIDRHAAEGGINLWQRPSTEQGLA
jgi:L-glyceraldehyde 3-phosphate reductase